MYSTASVPDFLHAASQEISLTPSALAQSAMADTMNSLRAFENSFGKLPYGHIAVTEQPQMFFGQSWPELVYLPLTAFPDPTHRWALFGQSAFQLGEFVDEVTPHEVSHQWWGHAVGWGTYHDQWLSEGLADFSAALFLQATGKQDEFLKYMERQRKRIVEKNSFGLRSNDAGPLWMGIRLDNFKTPRAYNNIVYPKGAFVVQMLRSMMWDKDTQDKDFLAMMQDFVKTEFNQGATTESFRALVTKHMKPSMDPGGDHTMNWFFAQWVYGTDLPKYRMEYSVKPAEGGRFLLTGTITQSEVQPNFRMRVPIYMEIDKQIARLGSATMAGNSTSAEFKIMLPKKPKRVAANLFQDVLASETVNVER